MNINVTTEVDFVNFSKDGDNKITVIAGICKDGTSEYTSSPVTYKVELINFSFDGSNICEDELEEFRNSIYLDGGLDVVNGNISGNNMDQSVTFDINGSTVTLKATRNRASYLSFEEHFLYFPDGN